MCGSFARRIACLLDVAALAAESRTFPGPGRRISLAIGGCSGHTAFYPGILRGNAGTLASVTRLLWTQAILHCGSADRANEPKPPRGLPD